jgi:hypothetical protein
MGVAVFDNVAPAGAESGGMPAGGPRRLLYTPEEAAAMLAVPVGWLKRRAGRGEVPSTPMGRFITFSPADLAAIVSPPSEPEWLGPSRRSRRSRPG